MFSMFSSKPHPAVEVLIPLLSPLTEASERTGQPLSQLVMDQYVAGFIAGLSGTVLKEQGAVGREMGKAITALSTHFGADLLKTANRMKGNEPDYVEGIHWGSLTGQYARGINDFADHPLIQRAIESANIL
jgi:hypothetical protein